VPIYEAQCVNCNKRYEWHSVHVSDDTMACPYCGGKGDRLYSLTALKFFEKFVTRNIDPSGRPILVESQRHLNALCNEHQLVHLDDPKWQPPAQKFPDLHKIFGSNDMPEAHSGVDGDACRREDIPA
jgi:putative FmdB family regulatory protein